MDCESSGTMEVAALGRPFGLGMLYDCRKDSLIPGITLWDRDDLKKHIGERPQSYNGFEIVASESIEDKSSALNVDASLKASFFGGLVEVSGSANYLNDTKSSRNQARVTLKYKATTKIQELSMDHLGRGNMKHPYVFEQGLATHVVTGILYGAQAFFVFDREVSENENHQDIQGNLKVMIKKIPGLSIEGEGSLKMKDKDTTNVDKFSCKFFGDFCLQKTPTSFQEAVEVYRSLPTLLGANGEKAVPMKVWLLPLTSLDSTAAKLVRQISIRLVQEAQRVLEDFSELEMRGNDALRTTTAQQFPQIGNKIKCFKEMCSEFKLDFQRTLAKRLPSIRGGGEEEGELAEILKKRHSSPFNSKNLNEWMDCKEEEIYTVMSFTNKMKNTKIIPSQTDLFKESLSVEHAVCFVFTSLGSDEPYLSALSKYLKGTTKPQDLQDPRTHNVEKEQWYLSKKTANEMRKKVKLFSDFAEANMENNNTKFLTVGLTNETHKGSSIFLYEGGFSVSENFEPPSKPETVTAGDINHNSVNLKFSPPTFGAENITSYSVEFCVSGEDRWQQKEAPTAGEVTVSDLRPNTEYMFRCRAVTSAGVGPANVVRDSIKTLPCSPPVYKLRQRRQLEASVESLQEQMKVSLAKLEETVETCIWSAMVFTRNWKTKTEAMKPRKEKISGPGRFINCQQCHVTCGTSSGLNKGDAAVGSDWFCSECPGKCHSSVHFLQRYKWEYKEVRKEIIVGDLNAKYLRATERQKFIQALIERLKAEFDDLQDEMKSLMERSAELLDELKEMSLRPDPLSAEKYLDLLIEGEKSEKQPRWKKRVKVLEAMRKKEFDFVEVGEMIQMITD